MTLQELYEHAGGSYTEARSRLMSDALVERFVIKFLSEPSMAQLEEAVKAGDIEESFRYAHTLKGVAANMAFTDLRQSISALTEQLRPRTEQADPALLEIARASYERTIGAIRAYVADKG